MKGHDKDLQIKSSTLFVILYGRKLKKALKRLSVKNTIKKVNAQQNYILHWKYPEFYKSL